ncbi:MAG: OmpA family protein [Treponemataceae bacterium]|jgi:outer membrane protein OmpA-like peptidoglycan-associated protein|nr:OmpA family protein [Treponemataceae bacterium]
MKKIFLFVFLFCFSTVLLFSQNITSSNNVDWTSSIFSSELMLDIEAEGIRMPSERNAATSKIVTNLPALEKDALLSLYADSAFSIGDMVLQNTVTFENISKVITQGKRTSGVLSSNMKFMTIFHNFSLKDISALLVKHNTPYTPNIPIETVSSRSYSGIIIDARGILSVQGEFVTSEAYPCLFPKIWDETMDLLYEKNMVDSEIAKVQGIVNYAWSDDESSYQHIVGKDPLRISARKVFGANRTDPVISRTDALKILSVPENLQLLKEGKVVILLDKENLIYPVEFAIKNKSYYTKYKELEQFVYEKAIEDVVISDANDGLHISIEDINFVPDSPELLPEENGRLDMIAEKLLEVVADGEYTLLVEGHTASVGKPTGEMNLSVLRAQTIINELVKRGINKDLFTYKGYGGTAPIGDNSTEEGRAKNRRVEIVVQPKTTYIQRF